MKVDDIISNRKNIRDNYLHELGFAIAKINVSFLEVNLSQYDNFLTLFKIYRNDISNEGLKILCIGIKFITNLKFLSLDLSR